MRDTFLVPTTTASADPNYWIEEGAALARKESGPGVFETIDRLFAARMSAGNLRSRASVRALRLIETHCTPIARPGMRSDCASSGRRSVATR